MVAVPVSRRGFIKGVGAVAAASMFQVRVGAVEQVRAAPPGAGRIRFGVQPRPEHTTYDETLRCWRTLRRARLRLGVHVPARAVRSWTPGHCRMRQTPAKPSEAEGSRTSPD